MRQKIMLIGEFTHSIDEKGRVSLPSKFKTEMGSRVILSRGMENTISVYTEESWKEMNEKLSQLSITKEADRKFKRFMLSGEEFDLDKQGRIRIPDFLKEYAGIEKKLVWVGLGDKAEIWSEERWNKYISETVSDVENISEGLDVVI